MIAFLSWGSQCDGLCGDDGILPTRNLLESIHAYEQREHTSLFWNYPSLFHWHYSDTFARGLCYTGACLAVLIIAGVLQGPLLFVLWASYLSIASTGDIFMGYQWDALLLEAGLLSLFVAPWRLFCSRVPSKHPDPPKGAILLLHWLLFRLMWLSGYVKIAGGDPVWSDMTALRYHFETQPIPSPIAWWMHHLPDWMLIGGCWGMYGTELILPFAIFLGRYGRVSAATGFIALMTGIFVTGNYNFFNLLSIALALTLLDDSWWPERLRNRLGITDSESLHTAPRIRTWRDWPATLAVVPFFILSLLAADGFLSTRIPSWTAKFPDSWQRRLLGPVEGLRSINAYGLFQDMTEERPEIIIEVSDDGVFWLPLEFKWKPGNTERAPGFVAPHQPRLDWQMWFASLYPGYDPQRDTRPGSPVYWFGQFEEALLDGKKPVWDLLEPPPFPIENIHHIRAKLYRYHFTTPEVHAQTGRWWDRELIGTYSPTLSLRQNDQRAPR